MSKPTVEELEAAEARLGSAFILAAIAIVCSVAAGIWFQSRDQRGTIEWAAYLGAEVFVVGAYVWYATAIGRAARYLVPSPWKYIVWVLAAPFLALIPIPIVSTVIGLSPLSLKFFFTGQLRNEIKGRMLEE